VKKRGQLLNAATLFFSKTSAMQLRCAVFGGTTSAAIIDRHDFEGDILELIEEAQKYILKNIHIGMRVKGLYREDVPEISIEAMKVVFNWGGSVAIRKSDRIRSNHSDH
jgi:ATP-dependent DNA helicase RecG